MRWGLVGAEREETQPGERNGQSQADVTLWGVVGGYYDTRYSCTGECRKKKRPWWNVDVILLLLDWRRRSGADVVAHHWGFVGGMCTRVHGWQIAVLWMIVQTFEGFRSRREKEKYLGIIRIILLQIRIQEIAQ